MSDYYVGDTVFFVPGRIETTILMIRPKGMAGLKQDYFILDCNPKKAYTQVAIRPVIKALKQDIAINECDGCRFLVKLDHRQSYCFVSNELVTTFMEMNLRPKKCVKGTAEEKKLLEESKDVKKEKIQFSK